MTVITLGGLAGGGARKLGPIVAQKLGTDYVDRLILTSVARHVGSTVEVLHQREERPPTVTERFSRMVQRVLERSAVTSAGGDPYFGPGVAAFLTEEYEDLPQPTITRNHELEDDDYIKAVTKVIEDLAATGNVVMVGRGAHLILKDSPGVLRVGVISRLEERIKNIMERERLEKEQAEKVIQARDRARAYYFKRFFGIDNPDAPELYHMVINMSEIGVEFAAELLIETYNAMNEGRLESRLAPVT
jgi:cytidylate kinase